MRGLIVQAKLNKLVESGIKLGVSLCVEGISCAGEPHGEAFYEDYDLELQGKVYKNTTDIILKGSRCLFIAHTNLRYVNKRDIHFACKPVRCHKKRSEEIKGELKRL